MVDGVPYGSVIRCLSALAYNVCMYDRYTSILNTVRIRTRISGLWQFVWAASTHLSLFTVHRYVESSFGTCTYVRNSTPIYRVRVRATLCPNGNCTTVRCPCVFSSRQCPLLIIQYFYFQSCLPVCLNKGSVGLHS